MRSKQAQAAEESLLYNAAASSHTLMDLYLAIERDAGLAPMQKQQLVGQIESLTGGMPQSTPLSALMYRGLGGVLGWLISKYFGLGAVGQVVTTLAGMGIGNALNKQLNKPKTPFGWMQI
jgi:hypothetical protein